ncbi:hypothetical protein ACHQM5_008373 [Ranunculus cassubicifolius]
MDKYSLFILVFLITPIISVSQTDCSVEYPISFWNETNCDGGNWGGFLSDSCCGEAFDNYLYLLGIRANLTGKIYFDPTEQRSCLRQLSRRENIVPKCGFERLTSGAGGCSDFSVLDVVKQLQNELTSLRQDCNGMGGVHQDTSRVCGACVKKWREIEEKSLEVCRFAILISLTSYRIQDGIWIRSLYNCLGIQNADSEDDDSDNRKGKNESAIRLLIGGLIAMAIVVIIATWLMLKRKIKDNFKPPDSEASDEELPQDLDCQKIPIKEIYSATNNLNALNFIGQGIAGKVYKGVLWNGVHVAVKHIVSDENLDTFVREVTSSSHVKHPNLVALLGHCEEQRECFLVYELCPNGNLSEWLFGKDKALSWIQRLEIAIDSARGLWFLHTFPEGCIVHRDIKPTNILLGQSFEAKLSDFGLSKVIDVGKSYVSSEVRGTFGYVDPEYHRNHHVNSYGDVYSFGIVLLQIISGRRVLNLELKKPMSLDKMAKLLTRGGNITEFADVKMNGEYSKEAFSIILKLALSCTTHKHLRPTMEKVVKSLECALELSIKGRGLSPYGSPNRT